MTDYGTDWDKVIYGEDGHVAEVKRGPRCGACRPGTRHPNVDSIKACHSQRDYELAQQEAERAAEAGVERFFEDRGYWEHRAQEDYEERMGVIPFDVAMAAALNEI